MIKNCITCKKDVADGTIAKAFGYCPDCYIKLTDGPEQHAYQYKKRKPENIYTKLVEVE